MRYFTPILRIPTELPSQTSPEDKLGGLPWGLPPHLWPTCSDCGKSLSLLAQFIHHPIRLDLGRPGRVLNIFQCNHDSGSCSTWEGGSGANACFVIEPEQLISDLTPLPPDSPLLEREVRIVEWLERDDGLTEVEAAKFFSEDDFYDLPEDLTSKITTSTRLGGVPYWIQSPDEAPTDGWHFIGQLGSTYSFLTAPAVDMPGIEVDTEHWEGRSHYCDGPNFGDAGIAYLFLRNTSLGTPEGWFFWQCG